jgi:hypothetical protein
MFERTRKFVSQKPTESELSKYQSDKIYEPSTSDVLSASSVDALQGQGTAYQLNVLKNVTTEKKYGTPISQDKFNELKGNANIQYQPDMTEQSVKVLKKYHDEQDYRNFVLSKATTGQSIAGFGASLATGFLDPKNIITGLGAGAIFNKGISTLSKQTGRTLLSANSTKRALQVGAGTALIEGAVSAPIDINTANKLQQEYSVKDAATDAIVGGVIGTGLDVGVTAFQARKARINEQQAQIKLRAENPLDFEIIDVSNKYNLDADILYAMTMAESNGNPTAVNADTGAYGFWQAMPATAKEYGVTKQSTLKEQANAFARFTADNVTALEKSLGREPNATETYLAHWLGRSGAIEVLKADSNTSFVKHMRNTPYYKKDGVSYAKSVMTQNRLPRTASMAEVINTAKSRVTKHLGASKHIPVSKDMLEKIDLKINQAMEGDKVDLNALIATHLQRDYQNGLKSIDKFNQSRRYKFEDIETVFKNNLNDTEIELLKLNQTKIEDLETRLQATKDKIEKLGIESNINPNIKPSVFEIEAEFYKTEFQDLKKLSKQIKNLEEVIYTFKDLETPKYRGYEAEEFYNIFKGKKLSNDTIKPLWKTLEIDPNGELARDLKALDITPKNAIGLFKKGGLKSSDNLITSEYTDYNLKDDSSGYADRDSLIEAIANSFNNKSFDKTRNDFIKESGLDPQNTSKQDFLNYFGKEKPTELKQKMLNSLKQKKQEYDTLTGEYDSRSNDLKRHALEVQNTAERIYKESIQNQLDVLNNPVYDKQAIDSLEKITQEVEDYKIDDELLFLEAAVLDYENSGLLDANDLKAIEYVNRFNKEDFENMKQQVTTCLLTGGTNEA